MSKGKGRKEGRCGGNEVWRSKISRFFGGKIAGKVKYDKALKAGFKTSRISLGKEVIRFLFLPSRF